MASTFFAECASGWQQEAICSAESQLLALQALLYSLESNVTDESCTMRLVQLRQQVFKAQADVFYLYEDCATCE
jgi:hypothetical protein